MSKEIYVGNLHGDVNSAMLRDLFAPLGSIDRAEAVKKKSTGKCRGFGFVFMRNPDEANKAILELNQTELLGNKIIVAESKPAKRRSTRDNDQFNGSRGGGRGRY